MEEKDLNTALVWFFAIVSFVIIGFICFYIGKAFSVKEEEFNWSKNNNVIAIGCSSNKLSAILDDKYNVITNFNCTLDKYYLDNDKLYVYKYLNNNNSEIGYYELDNDNKYIFLSKIESTIPNSIIVLDDHLYTTSRESSYISDYNLGSKEFNKLEYFSKGDLILNKTSNNVVIYFNTDDNSEIGIINLNTGDKKKIMSNVNLEYVYKDKVIIKSYIEFSDNKIQYYEYDTTNNNFKSISDIKDNTGNSVAHSLIVPYKDYYIYANGNSIYEYNNKEKELVKLDDLYIGTITLVSDDTLLITSDTDMCLLGDCDLESYVLDLKDNSISKDDNNKLMYYYVTYLK